MRRLFGVVVVVAGIALLAVAAVSQAQESPAAKATRDRLKKIILDEVEWKEIPTRDVFNDLKNESNNKVSFKIDTANGMSMNSRLSYKGKKVSLEKVLNDLSDKYDFGWIVYSNPKDKNDRYNGWVILRKGKGKERGYEAGKEPKGKTSLLDPAPQSTERIIHLEARQPTRFESAQRD